MSKAITASILRELAYFDVFDFPLTEFELWRYQSNQVSLGEVQRELRTNSWLAERVESDSGMYYLKGRKEIVTTRLRRYREAEGKFRKLMRFTQRLRRLPFVRMIAVCNSLAYSNSREDADIDLFIITQPARIWTTRMYLTGYLKLFGERPTGAHTRDTLCASFYIAADRLDLSPLRVTNPDIYLAHWVTQVWPLYDPEGLYNKFWESNIWVREMFPNAGPIIPSRRRSARKRFWGQSWAEKLHAGGVGDRLERVFENYQMKILPDSLRGLANRDTRVVLSDTMLKFHDNDRRTQYQNAWQERLRRFEA
ncbi:MAG: hypothetical protein Q8Q20_03440 [bacterium]|nr:hypothetical protein [bacterium]